MAADVDPACVQKIMSAGRAAWRQAEENGRDVEVVCHEETSVKDLTNKVPVRNTPAEWRITWSTSKQLRYVDHFYLDDQKHGIHVNNGKYRFTVGGGNATQKSQYKIDTAHFNEQTNDFFRYDFAEQHALEQVLGASYFVYGLSLPVLVADKNAKLVVARFLGEADSERRSVRLEWEFTAHEGNMATKGTRYWTELDANSWLINRCGLRNPDGGEYSKKIEYQSFSGMPFPKTVTASFNQPKLYIESESLRYEVPQLPTRAKEDFYLPQYGISESVVDVTRTSSWVRTSAIVLAVIGVAASIYFYWLSRKPHDPQPARG